MAEVQVEGTIAPENDHPFRYSVKERNSEDDLVAPSPPLTELLAWLSDEDGGPPIPDTETPLAVVPVKPWRYRGILDSRKVTPILLARMGAVVYECVSQDGDLRVSVPLLVIPARRPDGL